MRKVVFYIVIIMFFLASVLVNAEPNKDVYLVKSQDLNLKSKHGVRHNFKVGFTTHLTISEVKALKKRGINVEKIPVYQLSKPPNGCDPWPECKNGGGGGDGGSGAREFFPTDKTPWGIEKTYNDDNIIQTSGGSGINVAVLDTGVDNNHIDIRGRIKDCKDFTKGRRVKNSCTDNLGHGTHVTGTIASDGGADGQGIYGVAPDASILAYRVCGDSGCWTDDIAAAIDYAGSHNAHIVSMSLGGPTESSLIRDAIARNPQILFIAAAGNSGPAFGSIEYPGANPAVVAVAAIDSTETVASFSSRGINNNDGLIGDREVELAAPGVAVESTWIGGGYNIISGTSMATPHVSGLAAIFWQGDAALTRTFLQGLAKDIGTLGEDPDSGLGLSQVS
jgi:subtilisin